MSSQAQPAFDVRTDPALWFLGALTLVKGPRDNIAGQLGVLEQLVPPGLDTPYHIHELEDQAFYVLQGQVSFVVDGKWRKLGPGGYIFLPKMAPHGFRVEGSTPARYLIVCSPAGFEQFLMDASDPAGHLGLPETGELNLPKLVELGKKYKIRVAGPLPPPPPGFGTEVISDSTLIEGVRDAYRVAMNNCDADAFAALFTADAIQMPARGPSNFGAPSIRAWVEQLFKSFRFSLNMQCKSLEVSQDRGVETGEFSTVRAVDSADDSVETKGKYLRVYQRLSTGGWGISHDIWNREDRS